MYLFDREQGNTNGNDLAAKNIHIWDGNGSREFLDSRGLGHREEGDLGPVYGFQWRHFGAKYVDMHTDYSGQGVDQLADCIRKIKNSPEDRRIIMSAWNPADLDQMALPPCHMFCQFFVRDRSLWEEFQKEFSGILATSDIVSSSHCAHSELDTQLSLSLSLSLFIPPYVLCVTHIHAPTQVDTVKGELSCQMYQRSADMGLGVPFNIASYALLTHLMAQVCGLKPGEFIHTIGDAHVYLNHVDALKEQLQRMPRKFPTLKINPEKKDIDSFTYDDFEVVDYKPHKTIKMKMAV